MARIIDAQFHWHPQEFCELHLGRREYPRVHETADGYLYEVSAQEAWTYTREMFDLEFALERAREVDITAVISSPAIGGDVANRSLSDAVEVVSLLNSSAARAQTAYPDAFYGLAVLPMQDTAASLAALDQAASLGLYGVCVFSNINGADIADRRLWPVYERVEQLGLPLFLHPTRCLREPRAAAYALERPLGYMFDTSIAMMSLIVSGLMDACPQLRVVLPHLGGTLPYLLDRLETYRDGILWPHLEEPIGHYLRRTFFDTVSQTKGALSLALDVVDADHLMFATDSPYFPQAGTVASIRQHLPEKLLSGVFHLNAERLLGLSVAELELDAN